MPQFDFHSFSLQTFWILFFFIAFYAFCLFIFLPSIAEVLKMRNKLYNFYVAQKVTKINLRDYFLKSFFNK
jgi:hypothetical protein